VCLGSISARVTYINQTPTFLGGSNLHLDVLMGRDETIEPADVFLGMPVILFLCHRHAHIDTGMESSNPLDIRRDFEKHFRV